MKKYASPVERILFVLIYCTHCLRSYVVRGSCVDMLGYDAMTEWCFEETFSCYTTALWYDGLIECTCKDGSMCFMSSTNTTHGCPCLDYVAPTPAPTSAPTSDSTGDGFNLLYLIIIVPVGAFLLCCDLIPKLLRCLFPNLFQHDEDVEANNYSVGTWQWFVVSYGGVHHGDGGSVGSGGGDGGGGGD